MVAKKLSISVPELGFSVSGLWSCPQDAVAVLVLAHGAGAGMDHPYMEELSSALNVEKIATLRFQFGYMEKGKKRPDTPHLAIAVIVAAVGRTHKLSSNLPIFAGGRSFGGRMTTQAAAQGKLPLVDGIVCFSFPLHLPKKPSLVRAEHFEKLSIPTLFLQGTRDDMSEAKVMTKAAKSKLFKLHFLQAADHSYNVLKSSGRTREQVLAEAAEVTRKFVLRRKK